METTPIRVKVGVVDVVVCVSSHLKEELAWAVGKQLRVLSSYYKCYLKTGKTTKELKGTSYFKFKIMLYMLLQYSSHPSLQKNASNNSCLEEFCV